MFVADHISYSEVIVMWQWQCNLFSSSQIYAITKIELLSDTKIATFMLMCTTNA